MFVCMAPFSEVDFGTGCHSTSVKVSAQTRKKVSDMLVPIYLNRDLEKGFVSSMSLAVMTCIHAPNEKSST